MVSNKSSGQPMLNMVILGMTSGLALASSISGFVGTSQLKEENVKTAKNMLMIASIFSLLASLLLGLSVYLIHRHKTKMEPAFKGFFSMAVLVVSLMLLLISGIMFVIGMGKIDKASHGSAHAASFSAVIMSFVGVISLIVSLVTAIASLTKKHKIEAPINTGVNQKAPYTDPQGATRQLGELKQASGQDPGARIVMGAERERIERPVATGSLGGI